VFQGVTATYRGDVLHRPGCYSVCYSIQGVTGVIQCVAVCYRCVTVRYRCVAAC